MLTNRQFCYSDMKSIKSSWLRAILQPNSETQGCFHLNDILNRNITLSAIPRADDLYDEQETSQATPDWASAPITTP